MLVRFGLVAKNVYGGNVDVLIVQHTMSVFSAQKAAQKLVQFDLLLSHIPSRAFPARIWVYTYTNTRFNTIYEVFRILLMSRRAQIAIEYTNTCRKFMLQRIAKGSLCIVRVY